MWGGAGKRDGPGKLSWIREAAPSPQTLPTYSPALSAPPQGTTRLAPQTLR